MQTALAKIVEQRRAINQLLEENPSLKHGLAAVLARAYAGAREQAAAETGLSEHVFPDTIPYTEGQIFGR